MSSSRALVALETVQGIAKQFPLSTITKALPRWHKLLIWTILLLNIRAWPFVWHLRVFRLVIIRRLQHRLVLAKGLFRSPAAKARIEDRWLDSLAPVGANPFKMVVPHRKWTSIDECDFNGHLSNSSYAKTLDSARFEMAINMFPTFFRTGGWMALAATHYHFIREIPMLTTYEIRTSVAAWDQKWLYIMSKFVRKPSGKKKAIKTRTSTPPATGEAASTQFRTPGSELISTTATPFASDTPLSQAAAQQDTEKALDAVAAGLAGSEEPDGAIVHTLVISQVCYKIGRITVPPCLTIALNGFTHETGYSAASPHPQWLEAQKMMSRPTGGSAKKLQTFLTGGWRNVPEGERWWEEALGGSVEEQRVKNLALVGLLRQGLESAKAL